MSMKSPELFLLVFWFPHQFKGTMEDSPADPKLEKDTVSMFDIEQVKAQIMAISPMLWVCQNFCVLLSLIWDDSCMASERERSDIRI